MHVLDFVIHMYVWGSEHCVPLADNIFGMIPKC